MSKLAEILLGKEKAMERQDTLAQLEQSIETGNTSKAKNFFKKFIEFERKLGTAVLGGAESLARPQTTAQTPSVVKIVPQSLPVTPLSPATVQLFPREREPEREVMPEGNIFGSLFGQGEPTRFDDRPPTDVSEDNVFASLTGRKVEEDKKLNLNKQELMKITRELKKIREAI